MIFILAISFFVNATFTQASSLGDKLKTEDILVKHLESIGTAEARKSVKSILATGTSQIVSKGRGAGESRGLSFVFSESEKNFVGMRFNNPDYPYEKVGYDGDELTVSFVTPGQRSALGIFFRQNEETFKVGILGGALSTSWVLLDYDKKVGKLKCKGKKKINKVKHYKCSYSPKKSDLRVSMYFHPESFRHVKTEYTRVISGGQGLGVDNSSSQNETRFKLTEEFSDFKKEGDLMLPHNYIITYEKLTGFRGTVATQWTMNLTKFEFNNPIEKKMFKADVF